MDPTTLAVSTVAILIPFLKKGAEAFAEELGKQSAEAIGTLAKIIKARFKAKPSAAQIFADLEREPNDSDLQAAVRVELKKLLAEDDAFSRQVQDLVTSFRQTGGEAAIVVSGSGGAATHGGVAAGQGGVAVSGTINGGVHVGKP